MDTQTIVLHSLREEFYIKGMVLITFAYKIIFEKNNSLVEKLFCDNRTTLTDIIMATKKVYKQCCDAMQKNGCKSITGKNNQPSLFLIGVKKLVNKAQFQRCSKREQRRHLWEDSVLLAMYAE